MNSTISSVLLLGFGCGIVVGLFVSGGLSGTEEPASGVVVSGTGLGIGIGL